MAKYFLDCEFVEGKQDKTFLGFKYGETKPTIDLISIGIVCEDGREYYAVSKDFNLKEAWNRRDLLLPKEMGDEPIKNYWIRDNILKPIWQELHLKDLGISYKAKDTLQEQMNKLFSYKSLKHLINKYGKSNKQIAKEIEEFCKPDRKFETESVDFYGYYSAYDWVAFCWLFNKMIELPKGYNWVCNDLKQWQDRLGEILNNSINNPINYVKVIVGTKMTLGEAMKIDWNKKFKELPSYPKNSNEHNALSDAKWNYELYKFLKQLT